MTCRKGKGLILNGNEYDAFLLIRHAQSVVLQS